MPTMAVQGTLGVASFVSLVTLLAASPTTSIANDGEKQHAVGVQISAFSSNDELLQRFCGVDHVQDSHTVVIAHIEPVRT